MNWSAKQSSFEDVEMIHREYFGTINWRKLLKLIFSALGDNCLAQDRPRELKLVSLKPPGKRVLDMFFKFSSKSVDETAVQKNIRSVHEESV
jgi:hypothetical protein